MAEMIYISYGYFDNALAKQVSRMIEKNGYRCFYSYTDEGTGSSSESEEVMRTSPAMVLVLGENTCKSMWIVQEVSRAVSFDIPVIPVSFGGHYEVSGPLVRIIEGVETLDLEKDEDKKALLKKISAAVDMAAVRRGYMNLRRRPEKPYSGDEPYIFVSYSHRDMEKVFGIICELQDRGYRVWFDEGIDPATEWDENIAQHILNSGCLISFISDNYIGSENCKDEINLARDLDKPRLLVYIQNTALPLGMRMRLNRLQAIHEYRYENKSEFYDKLFEADMLEICK